MKKMVINRYDDIDYTIDISPAVAEMVDNDTRRTLMFSQEGAYSILNREIDRLHFRYKMLGKTELQEEIVARTIALKEIA